MITYRPLRDDELPEATQIFIDAVADLSARSGLPVPPYTVENRLGFYRHICRTGIFEGAVSEKRIEAIACAIVRGKHWFLSGFWARPGSQRQGIGRPLLDRVIAEGRKRGARTFFTWSSIDFAAIGTYLRVGLLPQGQIFTFQGRPVFSSAGAGSASGHVAPASGEPDRRYEVVNASEGEAHGWDERFIGWRRTEDRDLWRSLGTITRLVHHRGEAVGYYRVAQGTVGPGGWLAPEHARGVLQHALADATRQIDRQMETTASVPAATSPVSPPSRPEPRIVLLGSAHTGLSALLDMRMKIVGTGHLLASEPLPAMDRYIPSGPLLF